MPDQSGGSGAGSTVETSEPMPRGVIHDLGCRCWPHIEAAAIAQLRTDLDAARENGRTLAAYVYSTHNPGQIPESVKAAMRRFEG